MKARPRISLTYSCTQDWDTMPPGQGHRHCSMCHKNVIDFTGLSIREIQEYAKGKENICGAFTLKQVEPELIPASHLFSPFKKFLILIFSFVSYEMAANNNISDDTTRKIKPSQTLTPPVDSTATKSRTNLQPILPFYTNEDSPFMGTTNKKSKNRRRLFFSKRFPFLHIRKRHIYPGYF